MHGGCPFYSHALRGGNTILCGGRVSVLMRAARHNSDVAVAVALRGGDTEGVCPYAVGEVVS
jgi:hypothetical protein